MSSLHTICVFYVCMINLFHRLVEKTLLSKHALPTNRVDGVDGDIEKRRAEEGVEPIHFLNLCVLL